MNWSYRSTVLVLCMLAFFVTYFARLALSPVVPFITEDFEITNAQIGLALTGMWIAYGLTQFPSGVLADRYGEKSIILVSVGGTAVVSVLLALTPLFSVFVLFAVLLGAVAGLHYSVATTLLTRTYDDIGTAIGLHSLGAPLGGLLAPVLAAWVGVTFGWRPAVALSFAIALPVFVLFAWGVRPTEPRRPDRRMRDQFRIAPVIELLSRPQIAFTVFVAVVSTFVINGLVSFLPTFLIAHHAYSPTIAGVAFSMYFVVRGGSQVGIGAVSDRFGRDFALVGCLAVGATGIALLVVGSSPLIIGVAVALAGIGASYFPALDPRFLDNMSETERGAEFGLVRTVYVVTSATGPIGVGLAADQFGWAVSFLILAVLLCVAIGALVINWMFDAGY